MFQKNEKNIFCCLLQYLNLKENIVILRFFSSVTIPEKEQKCQEKFKKSLYLKKKVNFKKKKSSVYHKGFFIFDTFSIKKSKKTIFFCLLQYLKKNKNVRKPKLEKSICYNT